MPGPIQFAQTHWSVVISARHKSKPSADEALNNLCQNYWRPIYYYIRRTGRSLHDAEDLTQEFFVQVFNTRLIQSADPARGRFRTFIIRCLNNFLANAHARAGAIKRGGQATHVSIDMIGIEHEYTRLEKAIHDATPSDVYDHRWAVAVLEQTYAQMRTEYLRMGKLALFELLKNHLMPDFQTAEPDPVAAKLKLNANALRVAVFRFRHRFRELFRAAVAQTLADDSCLDEEVRYLISVLGKNSFHAVDDP